MATRVRLPGRGEQLGVGWWIVIAVLYLPVSAGIRVRYRNLERLPPSGPAILVTNHVSHIDPLLVAKAVIDAGRRPRFLAKDTIFAVPLVGRAMTAMGHIPVTRGSSAARRSFSTAVGALGNGAVIVLHPEGTVTRDPDGWPMQGKTGAARLALLAPGVPVIPVAQWGVQNSIDVYRRRFRLLPRPRHVVAVGHPIDLARFRDRPVGVRLLNEVTEVIMRRLRDDVAVLRGEPSPEGTPYVWDRSARP